MTYKISHQRLNFRFLKTCVLWGAGGKLSSQASWIKRRENQFKNKNKNNKKTPNKTQN